LHYSNWSRNGYETGLKVAPKTICKARRNGTWKARYIKYGTYLPDVG